MPEEEKKEIVDVEKEAVVCVTKMTTIPNSTAEFCIYTYKAETESYTQLCRKGFFNPAWSFLHPGDIIRVFRFNIDKKITHYFEYVVTSVDKVLHKVDVATIANHNLEKKSI